jgi:SAM-dependent MidA family methyltransferase
VSEPVPWRRAWQRALYGPDGFYRRAEGPAGHFATATHGATGRAMARSLWAWADAYGLDGIVDVGAGRGELLRHLYAWEPGRPLSGLDVVPRPRDLPDAVGWVESPGGASLAADWGPERALVVAHEWLDVVPCTIAEVAPDGSLCEVLVHAPTPGPSPDSCSEPHRIPARDTTNESLGPPLTGADLEWCQRFWPSALTSEARPGNRVEIGRQRDEAWSALLDRLAPGSVAVAVDYGHTVANRPQEGTLVAYREGHVVEPVPDGTCDLTAHVAVDSLRQTRRLRQREAVEGLAAPDHASAAVDPAGYLAGLADHSAVAELRRPGGFGDFWWVIAQV